MREELVRLADRFDQEGKYDLAAAVDTVILSTGARNKAPLKKLDEDVKKDLLKFLYTVKKNIADSMEALNEFFRRLRYFDINDTIKDMSLDKALKELEKTYECLDAAEKSMFTMAYGKRPSKSELEQMAEDFGGAGEGKSSPLEFFQSRSDLPGGDEPEQEGEPEEDITELRSEEELSEELTGEDISDLSYFWEEDVEEGEDVGEGEGEESFEEEE